MKKILITLSLMSSFNLHADDSSGKFWAHFDNQNKLHWITAKQHQFDSDGAEIHRIGFDDIEINKNFDSHINTDLIQNGKVCDTANQKCFDKYESCSKGLLKSNKEECYSNFYSYNSIGLLIDRDENGKVNIVASTILTLIGTPMFAIIGTVGTEKKFDNTYNDLIDKYQLEYSKKSMFKDFETSTSRYVACDISNLSSKPLVEQKQICNVSGDDGLFVYDGFDGLLGFGNAKFITIVSSKDLANPVLAANKITQKMIDEYFDMEKVYPTIPLPAVLPEITLQKSEFETLKEFEKRKNDAIQKREQEQKTLNETYIADVKKRNENIFEELKNRNAKIVSKIDEFRTKAFLAVSKEPKFEYISYDAELKKLYGWLIQGEDSKKVSINMEPKDAKDIKENPTKIKPYIEYELKKENDFAKFEIKNLAINFGFSDYKMSFTDVNYEPTYSMTTIPSYDLKAFDNTIKKALKDSGNIDQNELKALQNIEQWRVQSMADVSSSTVIFTNAQSPEWYQHVECQNDICGVGRGQTQQEALKIAMGQIGCSVKANIKSNLQIEKLNTNGYISKNSKLDIEQICENQFENGEVTITNSAEMDGWYYVRTVLKKKI